MRPPLSLTLSIFQAMAAMVDVFATRFNHRLPTSNSLVPDPGTWQVNAFSLDLPVERHGELYVPPWPITGKVLRKARLEQNPETWSSWSPFTYHRSNCSCKAYRYFSPSQASRTGI